MAPSLVHLPNGQTLTVSPVYGGLFFKANELTTHHSSFPPGWTVILQCEEDGDDDAIGEEENHNNGQDTRKKQPHSHRYRVPSLRNDTLFLSSISNPSNSDFKPPTSPTRQIAMMLWATLWWYFHQVRSESHCRMLILKFRTVPSESACFRRYQYKDPRGR
jgi:hypothetical protein